ncbi:response regulator [Naumannella sp. ID2617S]|nr:response regulator [Naumannella sp. ID2617S]
MSAAVPGAVVRALLVHDQPLVQAGLRTPLEAPGETRPIRLVGVATSARAALAKAAALRPDLLLMDLRMLELDGLDALRTLRAHPFLGETPSSPT